MLVPAIAIDSSGAICSENGLVNQYLNIDTKDIFSATKWKTIFSDVQKNGFVSFNTKIGEDVFQFLGSNFKGTNVVLSIINCDKITKEITNVKDAYIKEKEKVKKSKKITEKLRYEIVEHKATQNKLQSTEQFSRNVMDSMVNLVTTFDNDLNITYVNKTILEISGYTKKELIGKQITDFLSNSAELNGLREDFEKKEKITGKIVLRKKNGDSVLLIFSVSQLQNTDDGESMGFVCSMRDITDIEDLKTKLAFVEERYTDLFEQASDLIQGVGVDGKIQYANQAWHKILGYSKSEMKQLNMIDLVADSQKSNYKKSIDKLLKGEKVDPQVLNLISKSGEIIIIESSSDLKMIDDEAHSIRSIMRDITQTRQTELLARQHAAKIEAIFEGSRILFWTVNKNTALTSFNSQYKQIIKEMYGVYPELNMDENAPKRKFAPEGYHDFWYEKYAEVMKKGGNISFQTETTSVAGEVYFREIYLNPVWADKSKNEIAEIAGMAIDITAKKLAERKIVEQTAKIRTIFNSTPHMIWSVDRDLKLTSFNDSLEKIIQERFEVKLKMGDKLIIETSNQKGGASNIWRDSLNFALKGNSVQFEISYNDIYNKELIDDVYLTPIRNDKGEVVEVAGFSQTVTFKKLAEKKLRNQTAKISAIFDSSAMLIWTVDKKNRIVSYNKIFADKYFSLKGKDVSLGSYFLDIIEENLKQESFESLKKYFDLAFEGERQQFEGLLYNPDGVKIWTQTFLNPIYSEDNEVSEVACMSYEITEKKVIEEQMIETIREKEVLLQEVHHRVKNNLQVISSILNLQSSYVKDENSLKILRESQNRIKSMSFIHESLYHTGNFSQIEFSEYIYSLTTNLIHSYSYEKSNIKLNTDFEKTFLSLDQAIPCGLIVNEIISNALKYAFAPEEGGEIFCSIVTKDNKIELRMGDNGIGMPSTIDYRNSDTLGLQLIYTLIEQLNATIDVDTESGTNYFITFDKQ